MDIKERTIIHLISQIDQMKNTKGSDMLKDSLFAMEKQQNLIKTIEENKKIIFDSQQQNIILTTQISDLKKEHEALIDKSNGEIH